MRWGRAIAFAAFALMAASGYACSSTPSEEVGPTVSFGGGSGKGSGGGIGDGAWPDGTHPGGTGGAGGTTGGSGGSSGGKGGSGGTTGGTGGTTGGTGGSSTGGTSAGGGTGGGCTPISCMNYSTCQNESKCVASCPAAPGESCNLADDNCNGSCDESANCRVGVNRSYNIASGEHFYTTNPSEAACCGFSVEIPNYYYLYQSGVSGLVGFYRCALANGFHFYTADSNCEGAAGTNEGVMGYIATSAVCGAIPLYRLAASFNNDHLYTTDSNERASAQANGYIDEGVAGYVWAGP